MSKKAVIIEVGRNLPTTNLNAIVILYKGQQLTEKQVELLSDMIPHDGECQISLLDEKSVNEALVSKIDASQIVLSKKVKKNDPDLDPVVAAITYIASEFDTKEGMSLIDFMAKAIREAIKTTPNPVFESAIEILATTKSFTASQKALMNNAGITTNVLNVVKTIYQKYYAEEQ